MSEKNELKRTLGLLDATSIVAGSMIGSGIFIVTAAMMRDIGSPGWMLILWLLTGLITIFAALSYGELAKKMGDPNLVRAAASANGKNKIAIIVPCHRIVGADRSLVGYAWGKARKKWLLQHEFRLELGVQTLF